MARLKKVREELLKEGFGVLSTIDLKEKFREKLQKEFRNYVILGAAEINYIQTICGQPEQICNV